MGLIVTLVTGGVIGWLAGIVLRTNARQGIILNVIIGVIGALLGAFLIGSLLGGGNLLDAVIDPMTLLVAVIGAVLLLGLVHGVSRRRSG